MQASVVGHRVMRMVRAQMKTQQRDSIVRMSHWGRSGIVGVGQVDRALGSARRRGGLILNWWREESALLRERLN